MHKVEVELEAFYFILLFVKLDKVILAFFPPTVERAPEEWRRCAKNFMVDGKRCGRLSNLYLDNARPVANGS